MRGGKAETLETRDPIFTQSFSNKGFQPTKEFSKNPYFFKSFICTFKLMYNSFFYGNFE